MGLGDAIFFHQVGGELGGVDKGDRVVAVLVDADFDGERIVVGDAVFSFSIATMPCGMLVLHHLNHLFFVHKVVGAGVTVAATKVSAVGVGVGFGA